MASTYVNDLRLNEMATGDGSGTWGTTTNTNLELIAEAFSYGTEVITTNADTHTTTIADGATDPGRSLYLKYTGTLDSACTITIGPNTVSKVWIIENGTSGSQDIILSQGSGANITIPAGDTKVVYSDGAGAGAAFFDAFASLNVVDLKVQDDLTVTGDIDVDGTTNLDIVDIDGAVDFASTTAHAGDATFADNAKAIFGAGSDLQIYHDGSNTFINEGGTGSLYIQARDLYLRDYDTSASFINMLNNGAVTLHHAGNAKLATTATGIDVTGGVTSTGGMFCDTQAQLGRTTLITAVFGDAGNVGNRYIRTTHAGAARTDIPAINALNAGVGGSSMYIQSDGSDTLIGGNLLVGTTTASAKFFVEKSDAGNVFGGRATFATYASTVGFFGADRNTTDGTFHYIDCYNYGSSTYRFRVADSGNVTNTNNSYGAISDIKLKENIVDATPKLEKLNKVRVVNYNFIGSEEKQLGVIAQELEQIMPNMVDENVDTDADGNELGTTTKTVKYSVFVPMLIKAIQEQQTQIDALQSEINLLKGE
jgi:hypothetical protein